MGTILPDHGAATRRAVGHDSPAHAIAAFSAFLAGTSRQRFGASFCATAVATRTTWTETRRQGGHCRSRAGAARRTVDPARRTSSANHAGDGLASAVRLEISAHPR